MKIVIWTLTALIATVWTGLVALAVQLTEWAIHGLASGQPGTGWWGQAPWPAPDWLAFWIDPAAVQALKTAWLAAWGWMAHNAPGLAGGLDWLLPLMWVVWGLVLLCVVAVAGLLHWLVVRTTASPANRQPGRM